MTNLNHPTEGSRKRLRLSLMLIAIVLIAGWLRPSDSTDLDADELSESSQSFPSVEQENKNFYGAVGALTDLMFGPPNQRQSDYEQEEQSRQSASDALDRRLQDEREERYKQEAEDRYQDHQNYLQEQKEQNDQYYEQRKEEQGY